SQKQCSPLSGDRILPGGAGTGGRGRGRQGYLSPAHCQEPQSIRGAGQMICLSKRQILFLHEELIRETGGSPGLRDEALLDSALAAGEASSEELLDWLLNHEQN